jgi:hypothetical protein
MPTSEPLPQESGPLTPSFATDQDATSLAWRHARLRALTAVRAGDWPQAWQGFQQALSDLPANEAALAIGLRADMSHTDWLSGNQAQALQGFANALSQAEALPNPSEQHRLMAAIALVVAGLNRDHAGDQRPEADRLWPGSCSDPAYWPDEPTPPALAWLQLLRLEERLGRSTLFEHYGQTTAHAENPLIRWYHQQLAIRKLVRDDEPTALIPHLLACGRAFRAVHESGDAESSQQADSAAPLGMETLASSVLPPLLATMILQQGGHDLRQLLEGWLADVVEPSPETALRGWLQGALTLMTLSPDQAWDLMRDQEQALDARVIAGLRALSAGVTLERLYFLHCLVVLWAAQPDTTLGSNLLLAWFPEMVRRAWQMMGAAHPTLQNAPEMAETLLRVCLKPQPGWAGVRQILQTAQPAVNVSLSPPVLDAFQTLIGPDPDSEA